MLPAWGALLLGGAYACGEEMPTGVSEGLIPISPVTIEVRLPWEQFASAAEVFGGFGVVSDRGVGVLANDFRGLDARTLARWALASRSETVRDTTGTLVTDTVLRITGGRLVVQFDTLASRPQGPVTVSAHRTLVEWDPRTVSWTHAVDSAGERRPWPEEGGGPAERLAAGIWDRAEGDTVVIALDSLAVRAWTDTALVSRGVRLDADTEDERLEVRSMTLRYDIVPSVNPDTVIERTVGPTFLTFVYTPQPGPPADGLRVGGIPAWRSVIHMQVPRVLEGPAELCAMVGCPFELRPERINHASLLLQSRPTDPPAFQPIDTLRVDVRPVLAPDRLPKSPLGSSMAGTFGRALEPELFEVPRQVSVPVTAFVRAQLDDDPDAPPTPTALALLSFLEPATIAFGTFAGPDEPGAPVLRLIVTASETVELP